MTNPPIRNDEAKEAAPTQLVSLLDRLHPLPYQLGRWRCPRCGAVSAAAEDYRSGLSLEGGRCVRRHPPRRTLRCLMPTCRHVEVVEDLVDRATDPPPADGGPTAIPDAVVRLLKPIPGGPPRRPDFLAAPPVGVDVGDAAAAWRRVRSCLRALFEALADLDEAGGLAAAADTLGWGPRRRAKHLGMLGLLSRMLADAIRRGRDERGRD